MRTTIDIDQPILKELKRRGKIEGKSLGALASELLAQALVTPRQGRLRLSSRGPAVPSMGAKVDLADKDALFQSV